MASFMLNALTFRHDQDAAERTLRHFWETKDFFDIGLIEEHIVSQPLLASSLFSLIACSLALVIFAVVFLTCRFRGHCGSQKYQEYPSNSTNYAICLMLFFISWLIVTSASAYFVLAGIGFWSEKLDAKKPFANASLVRLSRSTISDLFANYDYHGDFESVSEVPKTGLRRVHISRHPLQTFRKRIEIPIRPLAEVTFSGASEDKLVTKNRPVMNFHSNLNEISEGKVIDDAVSMTENEYEQSLDLIPKTAIVKSEENREGTSGTPEAADISETQNYQDDPIENRVNSDENNDSEGQSNILVVTGETMSIEEDSVDVDEIENEETTTANIAVSTTTTVPPRWLATPEAVRDTSRSTRITTTYPTLGPTTQMFREVTWKQNGPPTSEDVLDQLLPHSENDSDLSSDNSLAYNSHLTYFSLHSRFLIFICRLTFCFVVLTLLFVILPTFFLVVAGTGCYIYSDHPMNRSSASNRIGQIVSVNASILLFVSPCMLTFSTFTLFYTHCHELLCATIQLQLQEAKGLIDTNHQSLIEAYAVNANQCSRSLAPVQSLLLSSLLLCISILPCVFAIFKLVKYYFRMSSEFYWNAADNFAGRQFSKQPEFPRYQSTAIYPDDDLTAGYAVYGEI